MGSNLTLPVIRERERERRSDLESCSVLAGRAQAGRAGVESSPLEDISCTEHQSSSASRISPPGEGQVCLVDLLVYDLVVEGVEGPVMEEVLLVEVEAVMKVVEVMEGEEDWAGEQQLQSQEEEEGEEGWEEAV